MAERRCGGDRDLLGQAYMRKIIDSWWRVKRSARNGNKAGYKIRIQGVTHFVSTNDLEQFLKGL